MFEEPLAAQQKLYLQKIDPSKIDFSIPWYGNARVSAYAKVLFQQIGPHLERGGTIDSTLVRRSARLCAELVKASREVLR